MRKTWVLTDTHFNHAKIIKYEDRPADFKERIISNWRDMVGPYDLVIHLGDVIFNSKHELLGILESMPGVKILTMGNHDKRTGTATWFMRMGFNYVCKYHVIDDVLLSHKPLDLAQYPGV